MKAQSTTSLREKRYIGLDVHKQYVTVGGMDREQAVVLRPERFDVFGESAVLQFVVQSVQLDQLTGECETDPRSLMASSSCVVDAIEALEDLRLLPLGDADARVLDGQHRAAVQRLESDVDATSIGVLQRI